VSDPAKSRANPSKPIMEVKAMEAPVSPEITSDDKLWSALAYVFAPLVSIILLLMEDKKSRPFVKFHAVQSLILGIIYMVLLPLFGCGAIVWLIMLYFAYKAYQGEMVQVPVITDFIKNQGWA
jgi:uncharacterized membrane protein